MRVKFEPWLFERIESEIGTACIMRWSPKMRQVAKIEFCP